MEKARSASRRVPSPKLGPLLVLSPSEICLAIIAGGQGRRLGGVTKALLRWQGRTLLERCLELGPLASQVLLNVNDDAPFRRFRLTTVKDVAPVGSPGGLVSALLASRKPWVLAVAPDMPLVGPDVVAPLLDVGAGEDASCFSRDGRLEPFPGLYRAALGPAFLERLGEQPSFVQLLSRVGHRVTEISDRALLDSVNTRADAERLGVRLA